MEWLFIASAEGLLYNCNIQSPTEGVTLAYAVCVAVSFTASLQSGASFPTPRSPSDVMRSLSEAWVANICSVALYPNGCKAEPVPLIDWIALLLLPTSPKPVLNVIAPSPECPPGLTSNFDFGSSVPIPTLPVLRTVIPVVWYAP